MSSAVLEQSMRTPAVRQYATAFLDPMPFDLAFGNAELCGPYNGSLVASLLVGALANSTPVGLPVQLASHSTVGQVWAVTASELFAIDLCARPVASVSLSAEEHLVLRQAIWDSVEIVAPGQFLEL